MIRLHEFITKIRNCKTQAEERAEYQKEMAAIRESFAVTYSLLRKTKRPYAPAMLPNCCSSTCLDKRRTSAKWNASNSLQQTLSSKSALAISVPLIRLRTHPTLPREIRALNDGDQPNPYRSERK